MSLPRFSVHRRVTILMCSLAVAVFGWFSLGRLELNLLPDISYPTITVRTELKSAPPEEIENLVSRPIEEALGVLSNLQEITSVSMAGVSDVIIQMNWGTNIDRAILDIREKLDALTLPDDSKKPIVLRYNPENEPIMKIALTGEDLVDLQKIAEKELKPRFETIEGIASAKVLGGEKEEIQIELDTNSMTPLDISFQMIASRLSEENINLPGGILEEADARYLVRTMNEFQNEDEIGEIVISSRDGIEVRLKDIASIKKEKIEKKTITHLSGKESVEIDLYKEGDANIIRVSDRLAEELNRPAAVKIGRRKSILGLLPEGVEIKVISDQSKFIKAAINEVKNSAIIGCLLAVIVLFLFLRNIPNTLIIATAIPISIIATFSLMFFQNISLNLMSLGGLALGIGMLVDNAIVVLENIFQHRERGEGSAVAAYRGAEVVAAAVTASTLTTIAVFFPIVFIDGIAGQIFQDLAWTVAFSLLASLIAALTLIPMLSSLKFRKTQAGDVKPIWIVQVLRNARIASSDEHQGFFYQVKFIASRSVLDCWTWFQSHVTRTFTYINPENKFLIKLLFAIKIIPRLFHLIILSVLQAVGFLILHLSFLIAYPLIFLSLYTWRFIIIVLSPLLNSFDRIFGLSKKVYLALLKFSFRRPWGILIFAIILLAGTMIFILPDLGMNLIPSFAQGEFYIDIRLPVGTTLEKTEEIVHSIEQEALKFSEIQTISAVIGSSAGENMNVNLERENLASILVKLKMGINPGEIENRTIAKFRQIISAIPGIEKAKFRRPSLLTLKTPLEIEIRGNNLDLLFSSANKLQKKLQNIDSLTDVYSTVESGYPEIHIYFNRVKLAKLGLSPSMVSQVLQETIEGIVPTEFGSAGEEIDIRLRAKRDQKMKLDALKYLVINPESSNPVYLNAVAEIKEVIGPSEIRRVDQHRVAMLRADVRLLDLKHVTQQVDNILKAVTPESGISYSIVGQSIEMKASVDSMRFALLLAVFLVYLVMASQFESLVHPLVILFSIPLAGIGVVWILYLFSQPISVVVIIGLIVLAGIVVNNAIVLIDTVNQLRREGIPLLEALTTGCTVRFRPILMTAMTTVLGLLPMAIGRGPGSEIRIPLALTVISGLVISTLLTLLIIPVIYMLVTGNRQK